MIWRSFVVQPLQTLTLLEISPNSVMTPYLCPATDAR
uniref:Uncharacterized protein n=1 Tax=Aegilops tauschii subsp. strangulata TaxID=200361 RepID=A0A453C7A5_AEGTS